MPPGPSKMEQLKWRKANPKAVRPSTPSLQSTAGMGGSESPVVVQHSDFGPTPRRVDSESQLQQFAADQLMGLAAEANTLLGGGAVAALQQAKHDVHQAQVSSETATHTYAHRSVSSMMALQAAELQVAASELHALNRSDTENPHFTTLMMQGTDARYRDASAASLSAAQRQAQWAGALQGMASDAADLLRESSSATKLLSGIKHTEPRLAAISLEGFALEICELQRNTSELAGKPTSAEARGADILFLDGVPSEQSGPEPEPEPQLAVTKAEPGPEPEPLFKTELLHTEPLFKGDADAEHVRKSAAVDASLALADAKQIQAEQVLHSAQEQASSILAEARAEARAQAARAEAYQLNHLQVHLLLVPSI
jgi:hypothetical protein